MLEIDGELFEGQDEKIRRERMEVLKKIARNAILEATGKNKKMTKIILDAAWIRMGLVWAQPLFPPKFVVGGIIPDHVLKGDIVHPSSWDMGERL